MVNRSGAPIEMEWIDFEGKRSQRQTIRNGFHTIQQTFAGHLFLLSGPDGPLQVIEAVATPTRFRVE
ncbi:MAG: hypothetical protein R3B90_18390 [Planctomycetaceae bacterium]